jgi:hypothetical protein
MNHDHRFEAAVPVYTFRSGEHAHVCLEAAATGEEGQEFVLEIRDISSLGFIAACAPLPEAGCVLNVRLPSLGPVRVRTAFIAGEWGGFHFERELDWSAFGEALLAADTASSRAAA